MRRRLLISGQRQIRSISARCSSCTARVPLQSPRFRSRWEALNRSGQSSSDRAASGVEALGCLKFAVGCSGQFVRSRWNRYGTLLPGSIPAILSGVTVQVNLPDDLVARIDDLSSDRSEFVAEAVRKALRESEAETSEHEIARINEVVDELNREAEDVLEYQVLA